MPHCFLVLSCLVLPVLPLLACIVLPYCVELVSTCHIPLQLQRPRSLSSALSQVITPRQHRVYQINFSSNPLLQSSKLSSLWHQAPRVSQLGCGCHHPVNHPVNHPSACHSTTKRLHITDKLANSSSVFFLHSFSSTTVTNTRGLTHPANPPLHQLLHVIACATPFPALRLTFGTTPITPSHCIAL